MNVVIYARFSSHSQTEQSIEGQLKVCYEYAESNHYTVVGEYIDRAISGTTDNRAEFQRMISDSDRHTFEGVLVYQLDRFARNRYDSAINKAKLKKNGVRVLSAKENIADDASGILVEGVLESMAEYYSVELSQKIHRGMSINAEKCLSNGSNPGLGFKVDAERRFYVDEEEAAIVREIYERYASGETKAEIIRDLKRRRVKTSLGKEFSPNSLSHLLSNKRYIGVYLYKGKETPGGMPRILDDDLFYRVQSMMSKNKNAPARTHGEGEYLLTTKLFCGHCKEMMVGYGGTSKTGRQYHYYMCKNARRKKCGKKIVSKSYIEDRVVNECLKMLTEEKIRFIAKKVAEECAKSPDNLTAKALKKAIREADTAIENLWKAIEQGRAVEMLTERLNKRMAEKAELEAQRQQYVTYYGSEEAYLRQLELVGISEETLELTQAGQYLYRDLYEAFSTPGSGLYPDEAALADYAAAQKYMGVYVVTVDDDKDAEGVARDLLARWQAAEDKEGEYAAICEELGQEAGSAVTLAAVEDDPLSDAIAALEEGGMDAVIDPYEDGTCYVVMRTETDMSAVAQTYFDVLWEQRVQDAVVVVNTKLYDTIDTGAFYEKLTQLRAALEAESGDTAG